jgi:hypothetical protein
MKDEIDEWQKSVNALRTATDEREKKEQERHDEQRIGEVAARAHVR